MFRGFMADSDSIYFVTVRNLIDETKLHHVSILTRSNEHAWIVNRHAPHSTRSPLARHLRPQRATATVASAAALNAPPRRRRCRRRQDLRSEKVGQIAHNPAGEVAWLAPPPPLSSSCAVAPTYAVPDPHTP